MGDNGGINASEHSFSRDFIHNYAKRRIPTEAVEMKEQAQSSSLGGNLKNKIGVDNVVGIKGEQQRPYVNRSQVYKDEFDAFAQYFEKLKEDNSDLEMANNADILSFANFCELNENVKMPEQNGELLNIPVQPIKKSSSSILYANSSLDLRENKENGRYLVANSRILKNEVIISEKATVLQVNPVCSCVDEEGKLYRCHHCASVCPTFYTCDSCNVVIFCSLDCLNESNKIYHKYECEGLQHHYWSLDDTDFSYIAMRMMLYGASKNFNTKVDNDSFYGNETNNYPFIFQLQTDFHKLPAKRVEEILKTSAKTLVYLIFRTRFFDQFKLKNEKIRSDMYIYIGGLLVRHYCQAQLNNVMAEFPNFATGYGVDIISGNGKAICPTIALINHSCVPNSVIMAYNNTFVVKPIRNIKEGEQITVCYKEINAFLVLENRQIITEGWFHFKCTCQFCEFERTWRETPYKCSYCVNGHAKKVMLDGEEYGFCVTCDNYFNIDFQSEKLAKICNNLYRTTFGLEHVLRIAECYNSLYPRNSWLLLDVYKLLYDKYLHWGEKPIETLKYGLMTFNILESHVPRLYPPLLEAKIKFLCTIVHNEKFLALQTVDDSEYDSLRYFYSHVMKTKEDLLFYVPLEFTEFYHIGLLTKLEKVLFNITVATSDDPGSE